MATAVSVEQLNRLGLPGYGEPAQLKRVLPMASNVLTLLVASPHPTSGELEVLTSVRKPDQTYPWAISLPTSFIALADTKRILRNKKGAEVERYEPVDITLVPDTYEGELSRARQVVCKYQSNAEALDSGSTLAGVTASLLERKLDINETARGEQPLGKVSLHDVTVGLVGANAMERVEYNALLLAVVSLHDRELIRPQTSGYQSNSWVTPQEFLAGYTSRDPERLHPGIGGESRAYVCTDGQCLRGAEAALQDVAAVMAHIDFNQ